MSKSDENRPVLKPKPAKVDYVIEAIAVFGLAASILLPVIAFKNLPDTIPTHYGFNGKADDWSSKTTIFILPAISIIIYTGLTVLNKFPHTFNYPAKVTAENALLLYTRATRIMRSIKAFVVFLFLFIEWQTCAASPNSKFPSWFLPVVLMVTALLPVVLAFLLTGKVQKKEQL